MAGRPRKYREGVDRPDVLKRCKDCTHYYPMTQEHFYVAERGDTFAFNSYCIPCALLRSRKGHQALYRRRQAEMAFAIPLWQIHQLAEDD